MNKKLLLNKRPHGLPSPDTWRLVEDGIPEAKDGQLVIKHEFISLDPAMRGWMDDRKSYIPPVGLGEVMRAPSVGKVIESNHDDYQVGEYVSGVGGVQQYVLSDGKGWYKVDPSLVPLEKYISVLGATGMTAYFGLLDVGELKEGDRVLISGAAGAVGSVAGQIAKIKGCEVVGIAGGREKCDFLVNELGFDRAVNYKEENIYDNLKEACPKGVDIYFDNVGGEILDAALTKLRRNARVVLCGAISQYNRQSKMYGPANYISLLVKRAKMEGFIVFDYQDQYQVAAMQMAQWMVEGKLKSKETICEGIENFHETFLKLFSGEKLGKLVLKV